MAFGLMPGGMVDGQLLRTPYFNWGWNYVVSSVSREPEVAYLFTLYATSPAMSDMLLGMMSVLLVFARLSKAPM